jgi:hypothetical protein
MIVFFLLQVAAPRHKIRSAFTRGSVEGSVYLEATMNANLQKLLRLTPGVLRSRSSLICQHISFDDGLKLLEMRQIMELPDVGNWVQVRKGIYLGDVGYVLSAETWGVQLLLIPCLRPPGAIISRSRRNRSTPALFDYETIHRPNDIEPVHICDNTYSFQGNRFEHGLIIKSYVFDSISTTVSCMPFDTCCLFIESQHPKLITAHSTFPRPSEWQHFTEGDKVHTLTSSPARGESGHITALQPNSVDLLTEKGVVRVGWLENLQDIQVKDFVEVTGGNYQGQTGWVDQVTNQAASIGRRMIYLCLNRLRYMNVECPAHLFTFPSGV